MRTRGTFAWLLVVLVATTITCASSEDRAPVELERPDTSSRKLSPDYNETVRRAERRVWQAWAFLGFAILLSVGGIAVRLGLRRRERSAGSSPASTRDCHNCGEKCAAASALCPHCGAARR